MIVIISGTNRPHSKTRLVADHYFDLIRKHSSEEVKLISLEELSGEIIHPNMYKSDEQHETIVDIQDNYLIPAKKWVIVIPEYNGSYPGIFKLFIDAVSIRKKEDTFRFKDLAMIGVASGRAGNLRGMDQLTNSMNYLGFNVFRHKLPLSQINKLTNDNAITDESVKELLDQHAKDFAAF